MSEVRIITDAQAGIDPTSWRCEGTTQGEPRASAGILSGRNPQWQIGTPEKSDKF
jgi:hypothetical protein